jgi:ABC-2 type transport system permease protein
MTLGRALGVLAVETKYEFLKLSRLPAYVIPTIAFPLMFYTIFGLAFGGRSSGSLTVATYLIATMGAFGVIGASMFGLGVGVAGERGQGWLTVKRASPMPLATYFGAKVLMAMIVSAIIVVLLFLLGFVFGHVRLPAAQWLALGGSLVLGAVPFCALGLAIGYLAGPNSAPPIVNMIYLPMSFGSGLWMPLEMLPHFVQRSAPALPPYHLARLALGTVGLDPGSASVHAVALAGYTVGFLGLAVIGYLRDEGKTYG